MIRSSSVTLRLAWAVLALLQLGVFAVGPLADASLEGGVDPVTHVESESSDDCGDHHDHLFCQLCRTVALTAVAVARSTALAPGSSHEVLPVVSPTDLPSTPGLLSPVGSRAPPRA